MIITIVAAARPNFVKIAPIIKAVEKCKSEGKNISYQLVHTGQHYDKNMSDSFFSQLQIPEPDVNLGCGGGSQAEQTAQILIRFEATLLNSRPDVVLVVGDVNSTMACAIAAKKLNIPVVHVEAGIRSGDRTMPEEINRIVTDSISDFFYTTTESAGENLKRSGIADKQIIWVGNTMIDTLLSSLPKFSAPDIWIKFGLKEKGYIVLTLHRPSNVDDIESLKGIMTVIDEHSPDVPIIFPVHPRTKNNLEKLNLSTSKFHLIDPLPYFEFNYIVKNSLAVITDSGGITEESTVLGIPCMTLRDSTERPETCDIGTNVLVGTEPHNLIFYFNKLKEGNWKVGAIPEKWDGNSAERIVQDLVSRFH